VVGLCSNNHPFKPLRVAFSRGNLTRHAGQDHIHHSSSKDYYITNEIQQHITPTMTIPLRTPTVLPAPLELVLVVEDVVPVPDADADADGP
jgi:hypothetical protein